MNNPYYPKKARIVVSSVGDSIGDLASIISAKRQQTSSGIDSKANKTNLADSYDSYDVTSIKKNLKNPKNDKVTHVHNIKGLSEVTERKPSKGDKKKDKKQDKKKDKESSKNLTATEEKALARSKEMLAKKAKIYEAMSKGELVFDTEGESIMVDFQTKAQNNDYYEDEAVEEAVEEEPQKDDKPKLYEYVDKFGRTRLLSKSAIAELKANDHEERDPSSFMANGRRDNDLEDNREYIDSAEAFQERLETHFQDIEDGERREYGVGHYKFSTDAQERAAQMAELGEMRKQTLAIRKKAREEKRSRKRIARERLVKICQEKGLPVPPEEPESDDEDDLKPEVAPEVQKASLKPSGSGKREWDHGKESDDYWREAGLPVPAKRTPFYTQQQFVQKQRDERNPDFAPPSIYDMPSSSSSSGAIHKSQYRK